MAMDKNSIAAAGAAILALAGTGGNYWHTSSIDTERAKKWAVRQLDSRMHDCKTDVMAQAMLDHKPLRKDVVQYCYDIARGRK